MIRIHKSLVAPAILSGQGVTLTNTLNATYVSNPQLYTSAVGIKNSSLKHLSIDSKVYGDSTVKDLLKADQHHKCCFCESKFTDTSYGDVEHFRPKAAYKRAGQRAYVYPGYYWLAYDWNNLMFSCEKCNRTHKRNEFPLNDESTRKLSHNHVNLLADEARLLIDPTIEDPSDFIVFKQEVPVPLNGSPKGRKTIEVLRLDRMNDARQEHLKALRLALRLSKIDPNNEHQLNQAINALGTSRDELIIDIADANEIFSNAAKDEAKFAYCVRCNFPELPIL